MKAPELLAAIAGITGGGLPSLGRPYSPTPEPLKVNGGPCPVEKLRRGSRKTRKQRKNEGTQQSR